MFTLLYVLSQLLREILFACHVLHGEHCRAMIELYVHSNEHLVSRCCLGVPSRLEVTSRLEMVSRLEVALRLEVVQRLEVALLLNPIIVVCCTYKTCYT